LEVSSAIRQYERRYTISHDEVSEYEDDIDQLNINMDSVLSPDDKEEDHAVVLRHLLDTPF